MSELKTYNSERIYWAVEQAEREAGDIDIIHLDDNLFYLKSETDKVIAEKDEKIEELEEHIDELQKATDSAWSKVNAMYDELCHYKYKRCLAMAKWCEARYDEEDAKVNGCGASWEYISQKMKYWERWRWRWEELAEKPTWARFLQLIRKEAK